jgi:GST-like protein
MLQMASVGPRLDNASLRPFQSWQSTTPERFKAETARLYGVLNTRANTNISPTYSIADIATWPWIYRFEWQQMNLDDFPDLRRWYLAIADRGAVQRGYDVPMKVNPIPRP